MQFRNIHLHNILVIISYLHIHWINVYSIFYNHSPFINLIGPFTYLYLPFSVT